MKHEINSIVRYTLYFGISIQLLYICVTPFDQINSMLLISTVIILTAGYIDIIKAKKDLEIEKSLHKSTWEKKRKDLLNYYNKEENINRSFADCLTNMQVAESQNERINKILNNYLSHDKKFKIKLNRLPENRLDQYLHE